MKIEVGTNGRTLNDLRAPDAFYIFRATIKFCENSKFTVAMCVRRPTQRIIAICFVRWTRHTRIPFFQFYCRFEFKICIWHYICSRPFLFSSFSILQFLILRILNLIDASDTGWMVTVASGNRTCHQNLAQSSHFLPLPRFLLFFFFVRKGSMKSSRHRPLKVQSAQTKTFRFTRWGSHRKCFYRNFFFLLLLLRTFVEFGVHFQTLARLAGIDKKNQVQNDRISRCVLKTDKVLNAH